MDDLEQPWHAAKLIALFMPDIAEAQLRAKRQDIRLAHYTSAENAMKIAEGKVLWLRSVKDMNDFREISHGADAIRSVMQDTAGRTFVDFLDGLLPGAGAQLEKLMAELVPTLRDNTFICSLSEHDPANPRERQFGRLSMWRAYAKDNGVAVIANMKPMRTTTSHFDAYTFPVVYADHSEIGARFEAVAKAVMADHQFVATLPPENLAWALETMLTYFCTCAKHPGFEEEREWRIVHRRRDGCPTPLKTSYPSIRGAPQPVVELPLDQNPPEGGGFRFSEVIDGIILGPSSATDRLDLMKEAIVNKLTEIGVTDPATKVVVSGIPFRS